MTSPLKAAFTPLPLPVRYSNRFGTVEITPVTEFMPVKDINKSHPMAQANTFDIVTAEKIALITENRRIQICFPYPLSDAAYLILHDSASTAAICRVEIENFECKKTPAEMLVELNFMA